MDSTKLDPVSAILEHVENQRNFVLQGGAGSGKTETLKRVVHSLKKRDSAMKIACITHTNKAADEIQDRIIGEVKVSTIHSFISSLIKRYSRNTKSVFPELFVLPSFTRQGADVYGGDEKTRNTQEHIRFKKLYEKLSERRSTVLNSPTDRPTGKRDYDKAPEHYNAELNSLIDQVNAAICEQISSLNHKDFFYNDTKFNNLNDPSYGHDGLLEIACLLIDKYPLLGKIIADSYDCIFIDEYQDTNAKIVDTLLQAVSAQGVIFGLFGDSEQAIYEDGVGNVQPHIDSGLLELVEKEDNYRCSVQVIQLANQFRSDGLTQKVAFKQVPDGSYETLDERGGSAKLIYAIAPECETTGNEKLDKDNHKQAVAAARDKLVESVASKYPDYVQLKLTNKSIASNLGFGNLYHIFDQRYAEPRDQIRKISDRLQLGEIVETVRLFDSIPGNRTAYNRLISKLRKRGFSMSSIQDKERLEGIIKSLIGEARGAYETVRFATDSGLITQSDSHSSFLARVKEKQTYFASDRTFRDFEKLLESGANTLIRMRKALAEVEDSTLTESILDERFDELKRSVKEKTFYENLFSNNLRFDEVIAFYGYEDESSNLVTMHKTKGTEIENVIVILDEYGWNQYDFGSCFSDASPQNQREASSRKLLYVACSRAKKNVICIRLVEDEDEASKIGKFFPEIELANE